MKKKIKQMGKSWFRFLKTKPVSIRAFTKKATRKKRVYKRRKPAAKKRVSRVARHAMKTRKYKYAKTMKMRLNCGCRKNPGVSFMIQGVDTRGKWGASYWKDTKVEAFEFAKKYADERRVRVRVTEWVGDKKNYSYVNPD